MPVDWDREFWCWALRGHDTVAFKAPRYPEYLTSLLSLIQTLILQATVCFLFRYLHRLQEVPRKTCMRCLLKDWHLTADVVTWQKMLNTVTPDQKAGKSPRVASEMPITNHSSVQFLTMAAGRLKPGGCTITRWCRFSCTLRYLVAVAPTAETRGPGSSQTANTR